MVNIMVNGSEKFLGFLGTMGDEQSYKTEKRLEEYKKAMRSGELLENIRFPQGQSMEGLKLMDEGIEVCLPKNEISTIFVNKFMSRELMNRYYTVMVMSVNEDNKTVMVSHVEAQKKVRPSEIEKIEGALQEGKTVRTKAKVVLFTREDTLAFVDILGLGIPGMLFVKDWSDSYTPNFLAEAKVGDIVDVEITGHTSKHTPGDPQYMCSRKNIIDSPWKNIADKIPLNSNILVRCISKREQHFMGKISGHNLTAYCFYPDKPSKTTGKPVVIQQGGLYSGYVTKVDEVKRILRARVVDVVETLDK